MRMMIQLGGVRLVRVSVLVVLALDVQLERDGVEVLAFSRVAVGGLPIPLKEVGEPVAAAGEGDEAQAVGENLILDDRGVVPDEDVFDGEGGHVGDHDAAEGVGDGGVDADEGEGGFVGVVLVELDREAALEALNIPGVVFAGVVAGEIGRRDIGYGLEVDADDLFGEGQFGVLEVFDLGRDG